MSLRPANQVPTSGNHSHTVLSAELDEMRMAMQSFEARVAADNAIRNLSGKQIEEPQSHLSEFDQLNEVEKEGGVARGAPGAWKPIGFMNVAHYGTLLKENAISPSLARGVEAFKEVSSL